MNFPRGIGEEYPVSKNGRFSNRKDGQFTPAILSLSLRSHLKNYPQLDTSFHPQEMFHNRKLIDPELYMAAFSKGQPCASTKYHLSTPCH